MPESQALHGNAFGRRALPVHRSGLHTGPLHRGSQTWARVRGKPPGTWGSCSRSHPKWLQQVWPC